MSGIDDAGRFGIYILTYPGDFYLSAVLVRSIKRFNPDDPIMIISGEGFDREHHPFDVPIMPEPSGLFWPEVGYQDRKIWAFQGLFETFLYLDADRICTQSLGSLIERIARQKGNFLYVQPWIDDQECNLSSGIPRIRNTNSLSSTPFRRSGKALLPTSILITISCPTVNLILAWSPVGVWQYRNRILNRSIARSANLTAARSASMTGRGTRVNCFSVIRGASTIWLKSCPSRFSRSSRS